MNWIISIFWCALLLGSALAQDTLELSMPVGVCRTAFETSFNVANERYMAKSFLGHSALTIAVAMNSMIPDYFVVDTGSRITVIPAMSARKNSEDLKCHPQLLSAVYGAQTWSYMYICTANLNIHKQAYINSVVLVPGYIDTDVPHHLFGFNAIIASGMCIDFAFREVAIKSGNYTDDYNLDRVSRQMVRLGITESDLMPYNSLPSSAHSAVKAMKENNLDHLVFPDSSIFFSDQQARLTDEHELHRGPPL